MKLSPEMLVRALDVSELAHTVSSLKGDMPLLYANQAFLDLTGYGRDEVVGRNCRFLQGPLTEASALSRIRDGIAARETVQVNLINYRKDGSTFVNHLYLAPVPDASGTPIAYMGIQSNVTPLHQRLRLDHEREKLAALGRLTAGISHEIKNALQPIRLMAEILEDWECLRPDDIRRSLATLRTNLDIALQLTTDVLGVARNPSHRRAEAVAATVLAAETMRFVEGIVPDTVRLRTVGIPPGGTPGSVAITVRHFLQVIGNLVTNAVDAMQGRGDLTIRWVRRGLPPGEAEGLGLLPGDYLRIDIVDTGCGVEERHLGELFETFFTTKPRDEGTGLGLAVSQSIVREAGGTITASSQAPGGSTFSIHLPTIHEA